MIKDIKKQVYDLLNNDDSGHGYDHIERVLNMSLKFAKKENADINVVSLIALLHDVDDYKLFGIENANNLTNAKKFMNNANVPLKLQKKVLSELSCIGYSRAMKGIRPKTIEGMVVSDADMCDCLGVVGILRIYKYGLKNGKPFFDKNIFPIENITIDEYTSRCADSGVCHIFEKILKLKYLMMTDSGKEEAINRHKIVVDVLYHLFEEENAPEWKEYLDSYIRKLEKR